MTSNVVILTGAGISAESGLQTFRASDGLWENHHVEDVATPEGFERNPALVQDFYNKRRWQLKNVHPNAAHKALALLEQKWDGDFTLITQNVDDLHERAGSHNLIHMHGELNKVRCLNTGMVIDWFEPVNELSHCPCCNEADTLRPHIVWFGEMPFALETIYEKLAECDLFIAIGTSANVYPAAGFVQEVKVHGYAHTVELNLEPSNAHSQFDEAHYGPATIVVPAFVEKILTAVRLSDHPIIR